MNEGGTAGESRQPENKIHGDPRRDNTGASRPERVQVVAGVSSSRSSSSVSYRAERGRAWGVKEEVNLQVPGQRGTN
jgi:hypothetical protein